MIMTFIPISIIMAKIIVPGIEGTMSSLQSTIINVSFGMLRAQMGIILNQLFFGIETDNIDQYYKLLAVELVAKMIPFLYIYRLIPTAEEVDRLQAKYMAEHKQSALRRNESPLEDTTRRDSEARSIESESVAKSL